MADQQASTLCILGCGNLGKAILSNIVDSHKKASSSLPFTRYIACVRSEKSEQALQQEFAKNLDRVSISRGDNVGAVKASAVAVLAADPADIETVLTQEGLRDALAGKLMISVVAGWARQKLETVLYGSETTAANQDGRVWIARVNPNVAARVGESVTPLEMSEPPLPREHLELTTALFERVGRVVPVPPRLMDPAIVVGGSTPAFFAVICDALIDAAVAVGVPRETAQATIYQSMRGTAALLQSGVNPGVLKDQGTSPEGCTIAGLMVMEEGAVRGHLGRAMREAVTVARLMGTVPHVNDTRH